MKGYVIVRIDDALNIKIGENRFADREEAENDAKMLAEQQPQFRWVITQIPKTWRHVGEDAWKGGQA